MQLFKGSLVQASDEELMRLFIADNDEAFNELYQRYKTPIYSYLKANVQKEIVDDLQQEVFYKLAKFKDTFKFQSSFKTWLWSITRNTLIDFYRNKHKNINFTTITNEDGEEILTDDSLVEELFIAKVDKENLLAALDSLSLEHKEIMLLIVQSEMSYEEIEHITQIKVGTIKSIYARSKQKIVQHLLLGNKL